MLVCHRLELPDVDKRRVHTIPADCQQRQLNYTGVRQGATRSSRELLTCGGDDKQRQ